MCLAGAGVVAERVPHTEASPSGFASQPASPIPSGSIVLLLKVK